MKKIILAVVVLAGSLFASEANMQTSMSKMENGIMLLQKGYLYNNKSMVSLGVKEISEGNKLFGSKDMEAFLPKDKKHMTNQATIASNKIDEALSEMENHLKNKEYLRAHESCAKIITACAQCHNLVRSW